MTDKSLHKLEKFKIDIDHDWKKLVEITAFLHEKIDRIFGKISALHASNFTLSDCPKEALNVITMTLSFFNKMAKEITALEKENDTKLQCIADVKASLTLNKQPMPVPNATTVNMTDDDPVKLLTNRLTAVENTVQHLPISYQNLFLQVSKLKTQFDENSARTEDIEQTLKLQMNKLTEDLVKTNSLDKHRKLCTRIDGLATYLSSLDQEIQADIKKLTKNISDLKDSTETSRKSNADVRSLLAKYDACQTRLTDLESYISLNSKRLESKVDICLSQHSRYSRQQVTRSEISQLIQELGVLKMKCGLLYQLVIRRALPAAEVKQISEDKQQSATR